jgi:TatD DNase family protein
MWIDHHCHLPDDGGRREWIDDARAAGVEGVVDVGTDVASSRSAIAAAAELDGVWATAGVHPHDASGGLEGLEELLAEPAVVAVGECGLDYHYLHSPVPEQRDAFARQVELAHRHDLALVIHSREAWDDTFSVLAEVGTPPRTVFHCFTGGPDEARRCLDVGASLSFSGIVTFPSADEVRDAARLCPLDRLLVETDSPYLAPVPHRGRPNRPALVAVVGAFVAELLGREVADVAASTTANVRALYRLAGGAAT